MSRWFELAGSQVLSALNLQTFCKRPVFLCRRDRCTSAAGRTGGSFVVALLKMTHEGNSLLGGQHHGVAVQAVHVVVVPPGLLGVHAQGLAVHHLVQDLWWEEEEEGGWVGEGVGGRERGRSEVRKTENDRAVQSEPPGGASHSLLSSLSYSGQVHFESASPGI